MALIIFFYEVCDFLYVSAYEFVGFSMVYLVEAYAGDSSILAPMV
ncbi:MAG: hypothetical protein ACTSXC_08155 [Candidatus Freyarchaeota archaeon]